MKINHKEIKLKVDNLIHTSPNISPGDNRKSVEGVPTVNQENLNSTVHISSRAANLQSIDTNIETNFVVDTRHVQQIKQAISDGTFKVNPEVVADRLIETAKALISTKEGQS
ncbi:MAG: flagellar biosynthesis anti-sigma factor FlgM [Nitrosomonas sp.]|nr:flagellar biosynthesis anti-sigma factor FlgM [Nitrosomonas sp.]MCW5606624.1 flagellar biosynthesis anti-sigma factor FlgM [Nitrosomonas sp.]